MGNALVEALQGSRDRAGVVNPVNGGWLGEGGRRRCDGRRATQRRVKLFAGDG
jgi:hypothetical protein